MNFDEYSQQDATGLAKMISDKEVTSNELLEIAKARCEQVNPKINAVVTTFYDRAIEDIKNSNLQDGFYHGVPFLIKDLLAEYTGTPISNGSKTYSGFVSSKNSELVNRYLASGVNIFGKTSTPEFGVMPVTEPEAFGPCRNPWDLDRTPGGSSGGSGSSIASGIVPMASGGDGGGSIRIPAACCGLFGLKPSRGRTPTGPFHGEHWDGAAIEHVLSRSVRDSAKMLDLTCGIEVGAGYLNSLPVTAYSEVIKKDPKKLKIGWTCESFVGSPVCQENRDAIAHTVKLLQELGHQVEEVKLDFDGTKLATSYLTMNCAHVAYDLEVAKELNPSGGKAELTTRVLGLLGRSMSAKDWVQAKNHWNTLARQMGEYHLNYDLLLTPTLGTLPVKIGELNPKSSEVALMKVVESMGLGKALIKTGIVDQLAYEALSKVPFTQVANMTGQPAMSVPLYWTPEDIPCGSHFMAKMGDECTLFAIAAQLERSQPWMNKLTTKL
jgi:amidase